MTTGKWVATGCAAVGVLVLLVGGFAVWFGSTDTYREMQARNTAEQAARQKRDSLEEVARAAEEAAEQQTREEERAAEEERRRAEDAAEEAERLERDREHRSSEAYAMCQNWVRNRLVSPSSADFPWSATSRSWEGSRFTIGAHVDAENRFGAKLRIDFVCVTDFMGDDRWRLVDLQMAER